MGNKEKNSALVKKKEKRFPKIKKLLEKIVENTFYKFSNNNWIIIGSMGDSFNWGEFN